MKKLSKLIRMNKKRKIFTYLQRNSKFGDTSKVFNFRGSQINVIRNPKITLEFTKIDRKSLFQELWKLRGFFLDKKKLSKDAKKQDEKFWKKVQSIVVLQFSMQKLIVYHFLFLIIKIANKIFEMLIKSWTKRSENCWNYIKRSWECLENFWNCIKIAQNLAKIVWNIEKITFFVLFSRNFWNDEAIFLRLHQFLHDLRHFS